MRLPNGDRLGVTAVAVVNEHEDAEERGSYESNENRGWALFLHIQCALAWSAARIGTIRAP
jgi:hypothetical protein